jgi:NAD(P)-dependent dehydrogenase (short-subunit alcohol dehydrogenase family)
MQGQTIDLFDLKGRVAMVTGGGSGLGREFCDVLAEAGADVVCPDLHRDRAEETCDAIRKHGHRTLALETDVSKYDQVRVAFKEVMETLGRLDILVNNAGISLPPTPIGQLDVEDWHEVIGVNLHGVFYCLKEGLEIMKLQNRGCVVNIASIYGLVAASSAGLPAYVASKFGVVGLTKEAAAEYGQYGIRVNCIAPGYFLGTRLGQRGTESARPPTGPARATLGAKAPLQRTGDARELRGLLLYLASDASTFTTGQIVACDGGWTTW